MNHHWLQQVETIVLPQNPWKQSQGSGIQPGGKQVGSRGKSGAGREKNEESAREEASGSQEGDGEQSNV